MILFHSDEFAASEDFPTVLFFSQMCQKDCKVYLDSEIKFYFHQQGFYFHSMVKTLAVKSDSGNKEALDQNPCILQ